MVRLLSFLVAWGVLLFLPYAAMQRISSRKWLLPVTGIAAALLAISLSRHGLEAFHNSGSILGPFFIDLILLAATAGGAARFVTLQDGIAQKSVQKTIVMAGGFIALVVLCIVLSN